MRTEREIHDMIDKYMEQLSAAKHLNASDRRHRLGEIYGIIDALLWVIGDESGAEI